MIERAVAEHERGNVPARLQQIVRRRLPSDAAYRPTNCGSATSLELPGWTRDGFRPMATGST